jgi:hypothetical protein
MEAVRGIGRERKAWRLENEASRQEATKMQAGKGT